MNPFLLHVILNLPYIPGPVVPDQFPSSYTYPDPEGPTIHTYYSWAGRDTMLIRGGEGRELEARLIMSDGCPVRETHFPTTPGKPDRNWDFTCSGGKVAQWSNGISDSGDYFYTGGRLDSLIRFERIHTQSPPSVSRISRIAYNVEGWPIHCQDYWYEGTDTADDSLTTNYVYHLPDSLEMRSFSGPDAETRVTIVRLSAGKLVSMTETQTQQGHVYVYEHLWNYGETSGVRNRFGDGRVSNPAGTQGRWCGKFRWRLDGRARF